MFKRNKKAFEMNLVNLIIALLVLAALAWVVYTGFNYFKSNTKELTKCDALGIGKGDCEKDEICEGVKIITNQCTNEGKICCITDGLKDDLAVVKSGRDTQAVTAAEFNAALAVSCNIQDANCNATCKIGNMEVKLDARGRWIYDGYQLGGDGHPLWVTVVVSNSRYEIYPGLLNCITDKSIIFMSKTRDITNTYHGIECKKYDSQSNWITFRCVISSGQGQAATLNRYNSFIRVTVDQTCACSGNFSKDSKEFKFQWDSIYNIFGWSTG